MSGGGAGGGGGARAHETVAVPFGSSTRKSSPKKWSGSATYGTHAWHTTASNVESSNGSRSPAAAAPRSTCSISRLARIATAYEPSHVCSCTRLRSERHEGSVDAPSHTTSRTLLAPT